MKLFKYFHSCILLEKDGSRILFDPGTYSFLEGQVSPEEFTNLSAVFITHNHPDHYFPEALRKILAQNPGVQLFTNPMTALLLEKEGVSAEQFAEGEKRIGAFSVRAIPAVHEKILVSIPENTAYLVDDAFLHPGDSLDVSMNGLAPKLLGLPTWAPWMTHSGAVEFAGRVGSKRAVAIHDWPIKDVFLNRQNQMFRQVCSEMGIEFLAPGLGEALEI